MKKKPEPKKKTPEKASTEEENAEKGTTGQHTGGAEEGEEEEGSSGKEKSSKAGSGSKSHDTTEKASDQSRKSGSKQESTGEAGDQGSSKEQSGSGSKRATGSTATSKEASKGTTGETGEGQEETEAEGTEAPEGESGTQAGEGEGTAGTTGGSSKKGSSRASKKDSEKGTTGEESAKTTGEETGSAQGSSKEGAEGSGKGSGEETGAAVSGENAEGTGEEKEEGSKAGTEQGSTAHAESTAAHEQEGEDTGAAPPPLDLPMPEPQPAAPPEPPKRSLFGFFRKKPAEETAVQPEEAPKPADSGQPPPQKIGLRIPFFGRASPKAEALAKTPPPQAPSPAAGAAGAGATEPKPSFFSRFFGKKQAGVPPPAPRGPPPAAGSLITAQVAEPTAASHKESRATAGSSLKGIDAQELDIPDELGSTPLSRAAALEKTGTGKSSDASDGRRKESGGSAAESASEAAGGGGESGKPLDLIVKEEASQLAEQKTSVLLPESAALAAPGPAEPPPMLTPEQLAARRMAGLKNQLVVYTLFCFVVLVVGIAVLVACAFKFFGCLHPTLFPAMYMINENTTCFTEDCTDFVKRASDSMTSSVLPCEDFYEHVCGGWMRTTKVPPHRYVTSTRLEAEWAVDDKIIDGLNKTVVSYSNQHAVQKAAALYKACTNMGMRNTRGTKPLENLLDSFGIPRWPIVHQDFQLNVMNTLADMIRELGLSAILSVRVGPDHHDTRKHIVYLGQPEFGVEREVLRSPFGSPYFRIRHRYKLFIFRCAQILGSTVAAAEAVVNDIVSFEGRLASITEEPSDLPNPKKSFHLISMESLESTIPNMRWTSFLNSVLRDAQVTFDKNDRIILSNRQYILRLGGILAGTKVNVMANYLAWRVVELMGPLTVERLRRSRFRFDRYRYSQTDVPEVSRECYELTARYMRFATAKILYDDAEEKPVERHDKAQHVADEVKDAFAVWLDLTTWMTESNKKLAAFKLRDLKVSPGSPLWVMSEVEVDEYYARIPDLKREEFFEASLAVMKEYVLNNFLRLRRYGYRSDFGSINFGALGTVIAYYLTLGFSAYGSMYNHKGILDDWWSGMTRRQYDAESVCFRKQVEWFTNPFTGEEINGTINQDELVADNAAIKESFKAYRVYMTKYEEYYKMVVVPGMEMYNQDQMFFIAYAMTMCEKVRRRAFYYALHPTKSVPNHHRTNLALMNFDRFSVAFDCPLGSPMNPELKCDVY